MAPAPAIKCNAPACRTPEPSHSARRELQRQRRDDKSRDAWPVSRQLGGACRCSGFRAPQVAALAVGLRRPGCQITGKFAFCFRTVPPTFPSLQYLFKVSFRETPCAPRGASTSSFELVSLVFLNSLHHPLSPLSGP